MEPTETTVERGSGNVFADLGLPDADAHLVKAELVSRIDDIIRRRDITQTEAARLLGLSQPDVSRLLRRRLPRVLPRAPVPTADRARARCRHRRPATALRFRGQAPHRHDRGWLTTPVRANARTERAR